MHKLQVTKEHYFTSEYNHRARWAHYFYQVRILQGLNARSILEIGPGNGWVTHILRDLNFQVTTVDIDPELKPDIIASVQKLPLSDNLFDVVLAAEVLEHLPLESFVDNLKELARVSRHYVVVSLPDHRRTLLNLAIKLPFFKEFMLFIKVPSFLKHKFDGQHYFEIGKLGCSLGRIKNEIEKSGLRIIENFVPHDAPSNHYFILSKA